MSPDAICPVVVADKLEHIGRMQDGIRSLPLESLAAFTADPRMVAAGDSYLRRALEVLLDMARHLLAKGFGRAPADTPRSPTSWVKSESSMARRPQN